MRPRGMVVYFQGNLLDARNCQFTFAQDGDVADFAANILHEDYVQTPVRLPLKKPVKDIASGNDFPSSLVLTVPTFRSVRFYASMSDTTR